MFAETLNTRLLAALERPDLRVVADKQRITFEATLDAAFRADPGGEVVLGPACLGDERVCAFHIRHALELSMLLDAAARIDHHDGPVPATDLPILAGLCAARVAARFWLLDAAPAAADAQEPVGWLNAMAATRRADPDVLALVWTRVRHLQNPLLRLPHGSGRSGDAVPAEVLDALGRCWDLLGPAETLMAEGGDARLAVDPRTGLNHYGCSHRPRPWAITFASSTASSLSERGFGGAEAARKRLAVACLTGRAGDAACAEAERVRTAIAVHYGLAASSGVVLAASGTDSELAALAMCCLPDDHGETRPVTNVLVAPDETGTGVPLAAAGRHFASDTARGRRVSKGERVAGFPEDVRVEAVPIRDPEGRLLLPEAVDRTAAALVEREAGAGRLVLMHRVDLSKTGLLTPGLSCLETLGGRLGDRFELVVDACQARLAPHRVRDYLDRGWMVMITGSKFFTGPPFCGALLLPRRLLRRLEGALLPAGLADYGSPVDWPPGTSAWPATDPNLPGTTGSGPTRPFNLGLLLRWQAALAEMDAFAAVPPRLARACTSRFIAGVEAAIEQRHHLLAVEVPDPVRGAADGTTEGDEPGWDELQTIRSFLVLEPGAADDPGRRPLDIARARQIYRWLNADVRAGLPADATEQDRALAAALCHIGQPAPVASDRLAGAPAGALRISVGARLLSGEPSHGGLDPDARMNREIADAVRVLDKIGLLLRHWAGMAAIDPEPRFASAAPLPRRADPGLNI